MKRLLTICAVVSLIAFSNVSIGADWTPFIIRNANSTGVPPTYSLGGGFLTVDVESSTGGQKVGYGTDFLNGERLDCITRFQVIRSDEHENVYAPYINIWVTDGSHYAVLSLEPSHYPSLDWTHDFDAADYLAIEPWIFETDTSDLTWILPGAEKVGFVIKVAGVTQTIADIGHLTIMPPTPSEFSGGLPGVGSGAPRELGTNIAYGFNLVFGDTQSNYIGGYQINADPTLMLADTEGLDVDVDIKGGSCPNPFNPKSKGSLPVAIVGTADLDVTDIDPTSLSLTVVGPDDIVSVPQLEGFILEDSTQPPSGDPEDCYDCFDADDPANFNCDLWDATATPPGPGQDGVDDAYCGDAYVDLVVKFDTQALADAISAAGGADKEDCVVLFLTGTLFDGTPIEGSDSVVVLKAIIAPAAP